MNLLIMGGTEFVSKYTAIFFINLGYSVDIFTRGKKKVSYEGISKHHIGDRKKTTDLSILSDIQYDYIIDVSAYILEDVRKLTESINTKKLKKYVFISTSAVYTPTTELITEEFETGENYNWKEYGLNKLEAETFLLDLYKKNNFPVSILRPTYLYGPYNNLYRESYFFDSIFNNKTIPYPNSKNSIQFLYINDLMLTIESVFNSDISSGEAYNITNETIYSFEKMLKAFEHVTKHATDLLKVDTEKYTIARKYFPFRDVTINVSIDKLKKHNLYIPTCKFSEGISLCLNWYKLNSPNLSDKYMTLINEITN